MDHRIRVVGPAATNVHLLADPASREAIAIDTGTPSLSWIADELAQRSWTLKLIVSTHGHWDHIGDNAAVANHTGAEICVHPQDRHRLEDPRQFASPFQIPPSVPAVELADGGIVTFGSVRLEVLHTPGHTEGSICLLDAEHAILYSGDTLFKAGWGRVDLPGGDPDAMVESLGRLARLEDRVAVFPGHGERTTIGAERPWMELVRDGRRLFA